MLWRKKNKSEENEKKEKKREQETPLPPTPSSSSSSLSSSSIFSFSWFSKLKKKKEKKKKKKKKKSSSSSPLIERSTEPIFSPPSPLPLNLHSISIRHPYSKPADSPHRLSLGDDLSRTCQVPPLARCSRHYSTGGDLDSVLLRADLHLLVPNTTDCPTKAERPEPTLSRRRQRTARPRARADRRVLEEIGTKYCLNSKNAMIKSGRRSFGTKVPPRPRVTVCSPRLRRRATTDSIPNRSPLERFAVAKSSSDPTRDFRESMVDMISEKGIRRPEELERLLACYLSLNSDEHQDAIVKVFRQVWFDLNRSSDRPAGRSRGPVSL